MIPVVEIVTWMHFGMNINSLAALAILCEPGVTTMAVTMG
jgi:hypothetical protein